MLVHFKLIVVKFMNLFLNIINFKGCPDSGGHIIPGVLTNKLLKVYEKLFCKKYSGLEIKNLKR